MLAPVFRSIFTSIINNVNNIYPHVPHLALNSLIISGAFSGVGRT